MKIHISTSNKPKEGISILIRTHINGIFFIKIDLGCPSYNKHTLAWFCLYKVAIKDANMKKIAYKMQNPVKSIVDLEIN